MAPTSTGSDRRSKSEAIHTELDAFATTMNAVHAAALAQVITAKDWNIHRDVDGYSSLGDWLVTVFGFGRASAYEIAAIARLSRKFTVLAEAATTGSARVDQVACAVRFLDRTPVLRQVVRLPYREPLASPFDPEVSCPTPEHLITQYCRHASRAELEAHLAQVEAASAENAELFEDLTEASLQRLEITRLGTGMWALDGLLSADTGAMFDKLLKTAVPPPRQGDKDTDEVLPAQANRDAEALHQLLARDAASGNAPTRHGHTATLNLTVDIETLQGKDTGRLPLLEGRPISLARARLLACEGLVIPSVFDYSAGEAVELGRAARLPNTALRRKLELEQQGGCAWSGCSRPVAWTEAHHIVHWADGGKSNADNLILLCRFHHGRIHTPGWEVTKTGPGQALIVHHDGHQAAPADLGEYADGNGCGCADYRTDADLDAEFESDIANIFPTGLYPEEQAPKLRDELRGIALEAERREDEAAIRAARAKARERFTNPAKANDLQPPAVAPASPAATMPMSREAMKEIDHDPPPFLGRPARQRAGERTSHSAQARPPKRGSGPSACLGFVSPDPGLDPGNPAAHQPASQPPKSLHR
ncbi:HNH endonuclease signature motif containing protein [Glycomyces buryatensis]|uniref:DUF222 domain-containing protein n=1 Tax=Glycomyces buryatensis TaxID=2570927 RepID=A0A4S8QRL4_9ACTN|nr:HNH endonuclease signature motif containing protein [Glycomyces buryatensis]THV43294.1 DUF222 domain-containing protein [Glycomyces buryatensis]